MRQNMGIQLMAFRLSLTNLGFRFEEPSVREQCISESLAVEIDLNKYTP